VKITQIEHIYKPTADFRSKQNEVIDVFTMVHQTGKRHVLTVMNNLNFIILDYLIVKKSGILD